MEKENNTNNEKTNKTKFIELKADCFKKMTEEEKQRHTKYAKFSIAYSIGAVIIALVGILAISVGNLLDKILGFFMVFFSIGACVESLSYSMSELQINKQKLSKIAYMVSLCACVVCAILFIVAIFLI